MSRFTARVAAVISAAMLTTQAAAQNKSSADTLFEAARQKESVEGDLEGAIKQYKAIVASHKNDRAVTVTALIRMAECYQKLGDNESRKIYERIVRDYADQKEGVTLARARLGKDTDASDTRMSFRQVWKFTDHGNLGGTLAGAISRDGRYLPYVDWAQNGNLFVHDFSAGTDRRLTDTGTDRLPGANVEQFALDASVSRDGRQLAYSWFRGDNNRFALRLVDLKGAAIPQSRLLFDKPDVAWIAPGDWSPDGQSIGVMIQRSDKTGQIGLVSVSDGALRVLKSVDWRGTTMLVFSPDGKWLAYDLPAGDNVEQRDIFVLATDGSREIPAVVSPSQDTVVGWSNDGTRLLFASDRSGSVGLWSAAFTGGKVEGAPELLRSDIGRISSLGLTDAGKLYAGGNTSGAADADVYVAAIDFATGKLISQPALAVQTYVGSNQFPDWSRDGKRLAYASKRGSVGPSHFVFAIRSMETGETREISPSPGFDLLNSLVWAPDGLSLIVRGRDPKGRYGIFKVDTETGQSSILVTQGERETLSHVGGGPDGKKLYYSLLRFKELDDPASQYRVWIEMDLTSGSGKELLRSDNNRGPGQLSPDGRYLAGVSSGSSVFLFASSGGELRDLAGDSGLGRIRAVSCWAGDSSAVYAVTMSGEMWRLPIDGSEPRKLDLKWAGNNPDIRLFRVHPDGRRIAFQTPSVRKPPEIWVLENFLPARSER
jgi:Tol biopolymer transport system component